MATLVWNNSGGPLPIPGIYGGGNVKNSSGVVINDTVANVAALLSAVPGDGISISVAPDGQSSARSRGSNLDEFISTEQTGTGSPQSIAHGMGIIPTRVTCIPTDTSPATAGVFTVTEGTHDATNAIVTVTSGKKFKLVAWP
jgi:hypothetical protein